MARIVATNLDFQNVARILNLPAPTADHEPARLADLNSAIEGLAWKDSCRVATTANINLSSAPSSIDGVTLSNGDRVLVKDQTSAAQNGIYVFNGTGNAMTRSLDANTADELEQAVTTIEEGTVNAGTTWRQTQVNFTLGTDDVLWVQFGTGAPPASETTAGIARIATQTETNAGTADNLIVTPLKLANWSGRIRKHTATIGDGTNTSYTVTHNFNTRDVQVTVYRNSGSYDQVITDVEHDNVNSVTIRFASAPSSNAFRVVVIG